MYDENDEQKMKRESEVSQEKGSDDHRKFTCSYLLSGAIM